MGRTKHRYGAIMDRKREFSDRRIERRIKTGWDTWDCFIAKESSQIGELKGVPVLAPDTNITIIAKESSQIGELKAAPSAPHISQVAIYRKREFSDRRIESVSSIRFLWPTG